MKLCIIDYKLGNINSILSFFKELNVKIYLSNEKKIIENSDIILLPGVGTFGSAINFLKKKKLDKLLCHLFKKKKPIIGICLGMQLFFESSIENGKHQGLKLIKGHLKKCVTSHIGWNNLQVNEKKKDIFSVKNKYFYFNHSYFLSYQPSSKNHNYYSNHHEKIASIIKLNNFVGIQFHPEKSQQNGIDLIKKIISSFDYA